MLNPRSFDQILEAFTEGNPAKTRAESYSAGWESHQDAFGLAQLLGHVQIKRPTKPGAYPPPPPRPAHLLDNEQTAALKQFNAYTVLAPNFSARELKSAYRRAVLKTHPDRGGTGESFQEVRKSYLILMVVVTK